jgi:hypothetical protein
MVESFMGMIKKTSTRIFGARYAPAMSTPNTPADAPTNRECMSLKSKPGTSLPTSTPPRLSNM